MGPVDILRKKNATAVASPAEIDAFVRGVNDRSWPDYQASALLMAIVLRGMDADETAQLTRAMSAQAKNATSPTFPPQVDKHSTAALATKTSLILAPVRLWRLCAMMSGRRASAIRRHARQVESIPASASTAAFQNFAPP